MGTDPYPETGMDTETSREPSIRFHAYRELPPIRVEDSKAEDLLEKIEKRGRPLQWIVGAAVGLLAVGAAASTWSASIATKADVRSSVEQHEAAHVKFEESLRDYQNRVDSVLRLQVITGERQDELSRKLDAILITLATDSRGRRTPAAEAATDPNNRIGTFSEAARAAIGSAEFDALVREPEGR